MLPWFFSPLSSNRFLMLACPVKSTDHLGFLDTAKTPPGQCSSVNPNLSRKKIMATGRLEGSLLSGLERVRNSWGWFLFLGIVLILSGLVCLAGDITATFVTILAFGWLLMFSGIVALVHAFRVHSWNGFFLYLLSALLRGFTGYALIRYPLAGAVALTLVLGAFFIVGGLSRAI